MAVSLTNPFGSSTSQKFAVSSAITWSPSITVPRNTLVGSNLTVVAEGGGAGQGTAVAVSKRQGVNNSHSGHPIYWETTWAALSNPSIQGGIGVIDTDAFVGVQDLADVAAVYAAFAVDGTNGCLLRPDGTIWTNGSQTYELQYLDTSRVTLQEGDVIGLFLNLGNLSFPCMGCYIVAGPSQVAGEYPGCVSQFNIMPSGSFVPCVVFGTASAFDLLSVGANFGANAESLIGPTIVDLSGFLAPSLMNLGWPLQ